MSIEALIAEAKKFRAQLTTRGKVALGVGVACFALLASCGIAATVGSTDKAPTTAMDSTDQPTSGDTNHEEAKGPVKSEFWGDPKSKTIYLTFDDGPNSTYTPQILKILKENDAKATFFMIGNQVTTREAIVRQVKADGHLIGNHTWDHKALTSMSADQVRYELNLAKRKINGAGGAGTVGNCMRPPGGAISPAVRKVLAELRYTPVLWKVDTNDFVSPSVETMKQRILSAQGGDIILMHDGGGDRPATVDAVRQTLPILKARGYTFATIPVCGQQ